MGDWWSRLCEDVRGRLIVVAATDTADGADAHWSWPARLLGDAPIATGRATKVNAVASSDKMPWDLRLSSLETD